MSLLGAVFLGLLCFVALGGCASASAFKPFVDTRVFLELEKVEGFAQSASEKDGEYTIRLVGKITDENLSLKTGTAAVLYEGDTAQVLVEMIPVSELKSPARAEKFNLLLWAPQGIDKIVFGKQSALVWERPRPNAAP